MYSSQITIFCGLEDTQILEVASLLLSGG